MKAILLLALCFSCVSCLLPPKFQWKYMDFNWTTSEMTRQQAIQTGIYNPANIMPTGIARWKNRLFITLPRWKRGIPSNINYVNLDSGQSAELNPYPSWRIGLLKSHSCCAKFNETCVCAFRMHVDCCDRLWVADNGVADMAIKVRQVVDPAILVYDLNTDTLIRKFILPDEVLHGNTILSSITVDVHAKKKTVNCSDAYAYITDTGANGLIVYSYEANDAWRIEHPFFNYDPKASVYYVGGLDFIWNDGIATAALSKPDKNGFRDLLFTPTSSTQHFKVSTKVLRNKTVQYVDLLREFMPLGDRGPLSQVTASAYDPSTNVLFFTQVCKNGFGCWNLGKPYNAENADCIVSDCTMLEFPSDITVDDESNVWVLSDRQSRFLYQDMNFTEYNFRVLTAPAAKLITGTNCEKTMCFMFKR